MQLHPNPNWQHGNHGGAVANRSAHAFTLIELLVVILVISMLLALTVPSMIGAMSANRLTGAGGQLLGILSDAQQMASAEGRVVEVRFYRNPDPTMPADDTGGPFRSVLVLRYFQTGEPDPTNPTGAPLKDPLAVAATGLQNLPGGIVMASDKTASTLLEVKAASTSAKMKLRTAAGYVDYEFPGGAAAEFASLVFKSEGTLNLDLTKKWYVTLVEETWETSGKSLLQVPNFFCIQVDPVNGQISSYRP